MPGAFWKLKIFRRGHLGEIAEASRMAAEMGEFFRPRSPMYYLDVLAAKAWLERHTMGGLKSETDRELNLFETLGLPGRRALFAAQGFFA